MELWPAIESERRTFITYLRDLPEDAWSRPSLCAGWTVRQVVAHLVALSEITLGTFLSGFLANGFNLNKLNDAGIQRVSEACPSAQQLIERLNSRVTARTHPPGPVMTLLGEVILHAEDVQRALGGYGSHPVDDLIAVADFYKNSNLVIPAKKRITGLRLQATDAAWSHGEGAEVNGPMVALLMAMVGRSVALDDLTGLGVNRLRQRLSD